MCEAILSLCTRFEHYVVAGTDPAVGLEELKPLLPASPPLHTNKFKEGGKGREVGVGISTREPLLSSIPPPPLPSCIKFWLILTSTRFKIYVAPNEAILW